MIDTLIILSYLSTATTILVWAISGVMTGTGKTVYTDTSLKDFNKHWSACRKSSLFFILLCWLAASGKPWDECTLLYLKISDTCLRLAFIWFVSAFARVLFLALAGLLKDRSGKLRLYDYMNKVRLPGFLYGTLFLALSYLLHVESV